MSSLREFFELCSASTGFITVLTGLGAGFGFLWKQGRDSRNEVREGIKDLDNKFTSKIDALSNQVTDIDKRLYGVEASLHTRDYYELRGNRYENKHAHKRTR